MHLSLSLSLALAYSYPSMIFFFRYVKRNPLYHFHCARMYSLSKLLNGLQSPDEIVDRSLTSRDGSTTCEDFVSLVQTWLSKIQVFLLIFIDCAFPYFILSVTMFM